MKTWHEFLIEEDIKFKSLPDRDGQSIFFYFVNLFRNKHFTKKKKVSFVLFAAKLISSLVTNAAGETCINLIDKWLRNPDSIDNNQLRIAAGSMWPASGVQYSYAMLIDYAVNTVVTNDPHAPSHVADYAISIDPSIEPKLIQYLHSIDTDHNNYFDKQNNEDQLKGFLQDLSSNEPIQSKHDTIQMFLDFLEDYGISNIRNLGHFSVDPNDPNSIFNNPLALNNFLRMIQNRIN